jgi:hypothetical protein
VVGPRLYLTTKRRSDARTTLYQVPLAPSAGEVVLEKIAELSIKVRNRQHNGMVTAAAASPDGRLVALLTYREVLLFRVVAGPRLLEGPVAMAPAPRVDALEGLTWTVDGRGLLVGGEHGDLVRMPVPSAPCVLLPP